MPQLKSDLPDLVEIIEEGDESAPSKDKDGKKEKKDPDSKDEAKPGSSEDSKCKKEKAVLVRLLPIQLCAARIESLIKDFDGKLYCSELEATFVDKYKAPLYPGQFGFPSVNTLIGTGLAKVGFSNIVQCLYSPYISIPNASVFRGERPWHSQDHLPAKGGRRIDRVSQFFRIQRRFQLPVQFARPPRVQRRGYGGCGGLGQCQDSYLRFWHSF